MTKSFSEQPRPWSIEDLYNRKLYIRGIPILVLEKWDREKGALGSNCLSTHEIHEELLARSWLDTPLDPRGAGNLIGSLRQKQNKRNLFPPLVDEQVDVGVWRFNVEYYEDLLREFRRRYLPKGEGAAKPQQLNRKLSGERRSGAQSRQDRPADSGTMMNEKANQRDRLILEFGVLIQPYNDLAQRNTHPSLQDYRIALAKVHAGDNSWRRRAREFCTFADDIVFEREYRDISHVNERFWQVVENLITNLVMVGSLDELHHRFNQELEDMKIAFFEFVSRIPIKWEPALFDANTPFTSYLRIGEALAIVNSRLHYFDRYLKEEFFHLFLARLDRVVSIRLVTTEGRSDYGVRHVIHISDLARRQFPDYQLIQVKPSDLHDRNLRVDDQIFTLGPGVDRAGMCLTNFGPSDSSVEAHGKFDDIITKGKLIHASQARI